MNNDSFLLLEENSEHANIPKVLINSPNLFGKNTSLLYNKIKGKQKHKTVKEKNNLINRINETVDIKFSLKMEDNINFKNGKFIKIQINEISNFNKNNLANNLYNIENNRKNRNKKIKNTVSEMF